MWARARGGLANFRLLSPLPESARLGVYTFFIVFLTVSPTTSEECWLKHGTAVTNTGHQSPCAIADDDGFTYSTLAENAKLDPKVSAIYILDIITKPHFFALQRVKYHLIKSDKWDNCKYQQQIHVHVNVRREIINSNRIMIRICRIDCANSQQWIKCVRERECTQCLQSDIVVLIKCVGFVFV